MLLHCLLVSLACAAGDPGKTDNPPPAKPAAEATAPALPKNAWPDPAGDQGAWVTPTGENVHADAQAGSLYDKIVASLSKDFLSLARQHWPATLSWNVGMALIVCGFSRTGRGLGSSIKCLAIFPLACLSFWAYGFALGWGNWFNGLVPPGWYSSLGPGLSVLVGGLGLGGDPALPGAFRYGLLGTKGFFLHGVGDSSVLSLFCLMLIFFDVAATIPIGAMAERWSWKNFCCYGL